MASEVSVKLLNHASCLIEAGGVRLLCDPWFSGTCFRGGWGLQYHNPDALEDASRATHLWISHFHGDHLHLPTLKEIASRSPQIKTFANVSANFDTRGALKEAGFKDIVPFYERETAALDPQTSITRYPATGIDNLLVFRAGDFTAVNFNDCNLPAQAIRGLFKKIGRVDVLLSNFNHANKLFDAIPAEETKTSLKKRLRTILDAAKPSVLIPFASMHYYRAPASRAQNDSLLTAAELAAWDRQILALGFGDKAVFSGGSSVIEKRDPALARGNYEVKPHDKPVSWEKLLVLAGDFQKKLKNYFWGMTGWLPVLRIAVEDHGKTLSFDAGGGVSETREAPHISAHSQALEEWFGKPYGTDAFFVGADFDILSQDTTAIRRIILAGDLMDNGLSPKDLAKMVFSGRGFGFLWNRREEIAAVLVSGRLQVGNRIG